MDKKLLSVGLDVGTSTTQLVVSRLTARNQASAFAVPDLAITDREICYRSPVFLTPLISENRVDGEKIREIVEQEYEKAQITPEQVDTGAVIITGETSRKENARTVLESLSAIAGDFVVATAGPDLESLLAAKGSGAAAWSEKTGKNVLHMDIGGGTSNLAWIQKGEILRTGCLNVGGRLLKMDSSHVLTYVSPVLQRWISLKPGDWITEVQAMETARLLVRALEMAAGLREPDRLLQALTTEETGSPWIPPERAVISFSGGVAECIRQKLPFGTFGDIGPELGQAIRESRLCTTPYILGEETIRATVIGAGCHATRLSGSTVFAEGVNLPLRNLPVVRLNAEQQLDCRQIAEKRCSRDEDTVVLSMPGFPSPTYEQIGLLAETICRGAGSGPVLVCLESDMAKALGQKLRLLLPPDTACLCIDRLCLEEGSYLDVGEPIGPAFPVIIKTLVLSQ